ncbi:MAG: hypothetical protein KAJ79_01195 [Candidatus Omnitrophica bacterium]|nr:hypothetical protein [Candidatus Omnitrophota bacterium]
MDRKKIRIRIIKNEQILIVHLILGHLDYIFFVNVNSFYKNNLIDNIKEEYGEVMKLLNLLG